MRIMLRAIVVNCRIGRVMDFMQEKWLYFIEKFPCAGGGVCV